MNKMNQPICKDYGRTLHKKGRDWIFLIGKYQGEPMRAAPTQYLKWVLEAIELSNREKNAVCGTIAGREGSKKKR